MTNQYGMARIHPSPHIGTIDEDMTQKSEELQTMDRVCERLQRIKSLSLIVWKGLQTFTRHANEDTGEIARMQNTYHGSVRKRFAVEQEDDRERFAGAF